MMTEQTNPNAELREALSKKGITNGAKLARFLGSSGVIFFVRGSGGWEDSHAELRLLKVGDSLTFYPQERDTRIREACVERAMDDGWCVLGVDSWSKSPFSNCWLPSEDIARLHEEFGPHELPESA